jgi:hypothetical protein
VHGLIVVLDEQFADVLKRCQCERHCVGVLIACLTTRDIGLTIVATRQSNQIVVTRVELVRVPCDTCQLFIVLPPYALIHGEVATVVP